MCEGTSVFSEVESWTYFEETKWKDFFTFSLITNLWILNVRKLDTIVLAVMMLRMIGYWIKNFLRLNVHILENFEENGSSKGF